MMNRMAIFIVMIAAAHPAISIAETSCDFTYFGDPGKFTSREHVIGGIRSDVYSYECQDCGGLQITSYPSSESMKAYNFFSRSDFLKKISGELAREDIAKIEIAAGGYGNGGRFNIGRTGVADFYPGGEKVSYLYFEARLEEKIGNPDVGFVGFISSTGKNSCTVISSFNGSDMSASARSALSYFMNNSGLSG